MRTKWEDAIEVDVPQNTWTKIVAGDDEEENALKSKRRTLLILNNESGAFKIEISDNEELTAENCGLPLPAHGTFSENLNSSSSQPVWAYQNFTPTAQLLIKVGR